LLPYCMCFIDVPVSVGLPTPVASVAMPPKWRRAKICVVCAEKSILWKI
jgi:hypothetical protein